jgi:hypothetical protein
MLVIQSILERMENSMLKCYGYVVRIEDNRWHKRIMTCSPEGRRRRGRAEVKWEKGAERMMKQRNMTTNELVNRQLGQPKIYNCWDPGKLTKRTIDVYIYIYNKMMTKLNVSVALTDTDDRV